MKYSMRYSKAKREYYLIDMYNNHGSTFISVERYARDCHVSLSTAYKDRKLSPYAVKGGFYVKK